MVTIATNMAGRGTDIVLGGNWEAELENKDPKDTSQNQKTFQEWKKRNKHKTNKIKIKNKKIK